VTKYFDITTPVTEIALSDDLKGELTFTVSNATTASIRGESVVIPGQGALAEWFTVDRPVRNYQRDQADQVGVAVTVPKDAAPGEYAFQLRTLLGGGVPEEDYDDSPSVSFVVPEPPKPPPPKKPFPWWILLVIAAIVIAIIVIGGIVFVATRPGASPSPSPNPTPPPTAPPTPEPRPDLVVGRPTIEVGRLVVEVINAGTAPAGSFDVFVVDQSSIFQPVEFRETVPGLRAGGRDTVLFPAKAITALEDLFIQVDPQDVVAESNERNNTFGRRQRQP
jgi:hypothetical protein